MTKTIKAGEEIFRIDADEYGIIINGPLTYGLISTVCITGIFFPWTDEEGTQLDLLFSYQPSMLNAAQIQRGLGKGNKLFVSVSGASMFGFDAFKPTSSLYPIYVAEKLKLNKGITSEKLTELIIGVIDELQRKESVHE